VRFRGVLLRLFLVGMAVWWALSDGPLRAVGEWAVTVYVLWRAAPAIRPDIGRLIGFLSGLGGRVRLPSGRDRGNTL